MKRKEKWWEKEGLLATVIGTLLIVVTLLSADYSHAGEVIIIQGPDNAANPVYIEQDGDVLRVRPIGDQ